MSDGMAQMHERGQEPVDEHQPVLRCLTSSTVTSLRKPGVRSSAGPPAPTARFRGLEASLAWCRSCHNGPTSATSSAITSADRPVILRSLTIAARDAFPTTQP